MYVLCALAFEARHVQRALARAGLNNVEILVTGPGQDAMKRALEELLARAATHESGEVLCVLSGVAGGLIDDVGAVVCPSFVVSAEGERWCAHDQVERYTDGCVVVSVDQPVCEPEAKRALHERTGAQCVDTESATFARACEDARIEWCVVRGISDGSNDTLPRQTCEWVDGTVAREVCELRSIYCARRHRSRVWCASDGKVITPCAWRPQRVSDIIRSWFGRASEHDTHTLDR